MEGPVASGCMGNPSIKGKVGSEGTFGSPWPGQPHPVYLILKWCH